MIVSFHYFLNFYINIILISKLNLIF